MTNDNVWKIFKDGFSVLLNSKIDFKEIDSKIENANLHFTKSKKAEVNKNINSDYIICLNELFINKLSDNDINILMNKSLVDEEVLNIVNRSLEDILIKDGVKMITYEYTIPDRIIENGTIVLEFLYAKNDVELRGEDYINNYKKQQEFINTLKQDIEEKVEREFNIKCKLLIDKTVWDKFNIILNYKKFGE